MVPPYNTKSTLIQSLNLSWKQLPPVYLVLLVITGILLPIVLIFGTLFLLTLGPDLGVAGILLLPPIIIGSIILTPIILVLLPKLGRAGLAIACTLIIILGLGLSWLYIGKSALQNLKSLPFEVYTPAVLPNGYVPIKDNPYISKGKQPQHITKYTKAVYDEDLSRSVDRHLEVHQFSVPAEYNPPVNCTYFALTVSSSRKIWPCELFGKTGTGKEIYINKTLEAAYANINGTLVTMNWEEGQKITDDELITIFNSLQSVADIP